MNETKENVIEGTIGTAPLEVSNEPTTNDILNAMLGVKE